MAAGRGRSTRTPLTTPDCSTPSAAVYHLGVSFTAKHLACGTPACPSAGHVNVPKRQINGFRNRDLRQLLFADDSAPPEDQRRHAAAVSRKLALLRAHGLIRKITGTHRYHLSVRGRIIVTALITARNASVDALTKLAA
jgi:hypothetical protein